MGNAPRLSTFEVGIIIASNYLRHFLFNIYGYQANHFMFIFLILIFTKTL